MKLPKISIAFMVCALFMFSCASDGGESESNGIVSGGGEDTESNEGKESPKGNNIPIELSAEFPTMFSTGFIGKSKEQVLENVDKMIDKELGAYLIYKPGAAAIQKRFTSAESLKDIFAYIDDVLVEFKEIPKKEELPYFDCESFDKQGNYYKEVEKGGRIQMAMNDEKNLLYTDFPEEEVAMMEKADNTTSIILVSTNAQVEMSFAKVNGEWKITTINIADFDCGA